MNFFRAISSLLRFDRTNWKALSLCVFAATIFWTFNALNKTYSTNVSFPLTFAYDNDKYLPSEALPARLTLNVGGIGWDLLRKSVGVKVPTLSLDLERPTEVRKIPGAALSPQVAGQIGGLQLNYIVTDTLHIHLEPKVQRTVFLAADMTSVTFKNGFDRTSLTVVVPDTALLEGPKSLVESLKDTILLKIQGNKLNSGLHKSVEILLPNGDFIRRNPPVADVSFDVLPVEEIFLQVKLKAPKMPWGVDVDLDSVMCTFSIPVTSHEQFETDASAVEATFTLVELAKGESKLIRPKVTGLPSYTRLVHVDSIRLKRY